ncbi:hypothetical protein Q4F19_03275 [Sphingomonas sp. BIUV-7]|uniref:Uncharacterized protein n=1 Tax=Sphingomonas natans TaxID=3063330 RepID=A0ABT8Y500_9SPHN|nr:hypothetical protein [Sphingomonas sp. BIUV-7]MDO6413394.1 hypothetical protein [Sphingomonas sp. BIUV-7]
MAHLLAMFDQVRIVNLVDRPDRRREVTAQIARVGGFDGGRVAFHTARRPENPGDFPSLGARGCFESQLAVLRNARDSGARKLLLLEDDLDFVGVERGPAIFNELAKRDWSFFYGAHREEAQGRTGLVRLSPDEVVITASFLAFDGKVIAPLVDWLEAVQQRPAGSPEYGPMHVDGAYSVYRALNPDLETYAAFPPLGRQRSSRSDITQTGMILDRYAATRPIANLLRRGIEHLRG